MLALDRALISELVGALEEAQVLAMAVDSTPGVGEPYLRTACELASQLNQQLAKTVPAARARNRARAGAQVIWINFIEVIQDVLAKGFHNGRPYDRHHAREAALTIAFICNELPERRKARDRVLARDPRREALIGARNMALNRARDVALAFAENLQEPWRPAYVLEFLARLLPPDERELFLEEHLASLAHASRGEKWAYLLDLLTSLPAAAWTLRTVPRDPALNPAAVASPHTAGAQLGGPAILPTAPSTDRWGLLLWLAEILPISSTNDEQPTGATHPLAERGLPQGA